MTCSIVDSNTHAAMFISVERMKTEKPKKVPTRKPLEMMDVDGKVRTAPKEQVSYKLLGL